MSGSPTIVLFAGCDLPSKVAEGRLEGIAPCTACEHCISFRVYREPVRCRINASVGSNAPYEITGAGKKKKVVVAGTGQGSPKRNRCN